MLLAGKLKFVPACLNVNTPAQQELFKQPPHTVDSDVAWIETYLRNNKGWHNANELLVSIGRPATENNRRWLRKPVSMSKWIISGQKGYKHMEHSTAEELDHAANWLESEGKELFERALSIRANAHKIFG
jgi:hypothetical protein